MRGDDSFGVKVIEQLKKDHPKLGKFIIEEADLTRLINQWHNQDVVIIDAIQSNAARAGQIYRATDFDKVGAEICNKYSSHRLSVAEVYELSQQLNLQPRSTYFIGVVGENWKLGSSMGEAIQSKLEAVKEEVVEYCQSA